MLVNAERPKRIQKSLKRDESEAGAGHPAPQPAEKPQPQHGALLGHPPYRRTAFRDSLCLVAKARGYGSRVGSITRPPNDTPT